MANGAFPPILSPATPFKDTLPVPLEQGCMVFICGVGHGDRFSVDFETDSGDKALHFNPRYKEEKVIRNSMIGGTWQAEEKYGCFPFKSDQNFELIFEVLRDCFKIFVNGRELGGFTHRLPVETIRRICIQGDIIMSAVRYQPPNPYGIDLRLTAPSCSLINPPVPFSGRIQGGLSAGRMIIINGTPTGQSFSINLQNDNGDVADVGFHADVRFDAGDGEIVVRNSYLNGAWGHEERDVSYFPFVKDSPFDLILYVEQKKIKIAVNNRKYLKFKHRVSPNSLDHLKIIGGVAIVMLRYF